MKVAMNSADLTPRALSGRWKSSFDGSLQSDFAWRSRQRRFMGPSALEFHGRGENLAWRSQESVSSERSGRKME